MVALTHVLWLAVAFTTGLSFVLYWGNAPTLIVAYDGKRGEAQKGRARLSKGLKDREERNAVDVGDCVDCGYCVQVCPTGIDIRDGLQLECISCALCVDACDTIMDSLRWPRGLVGYTSERVQGGNTPRILRPKTIAYGLALAMAMGGLVASVAARVRRQPLKITEPQAAFVFEVLPLNVDNFPAVEQSAQFSAPQPQDGGVR